MQPFILLPASPRSGIHRARRLLLCCLLAILSFSLDASAQNLVNNPSFEIMTGCPFGLSDLGDQVGPNCTYWFSANGATPDYFHSCTQATVCGSMLNSSLYMASVPQNAFGNQAAFDDPNNPYDTQNAYGGIVYVPSSVDQTRDRREYLEVSLASPLIKDREYEVSFYVSLADGSQYALTDLGAYLSVGEIKNTSTIFGLGVSPQIYDNTKFFTDKVNWVQITGTYVAAGGEDHVVIGYFRSTLYSGTDYISVPIDVDDISCYAQELPAYGEFAYYYIDQVSVREICVCESDGYNAYDVEVVEDEEQADDATECCYQIKLTKNENACDVPNVRIGLLPIVVADASYNNFNETYTVTGNWSKTSSSSTAATWTRDPNADPQEINITEVVGGLCIKQYNVPRTLLIEYFDDAMNLMCSETVELPLCYTPPNCCEDLHAFKGEMCAIIPGGTDPDACCRGVYITQDAGVNCEVYGVVLTGATGGVELQSTPIIFPPSGASGSELQCYGYYCLEPGETRTILVDFLDSDGNVFCTKSITDNCELVCCESISLGVELPSYPPWNVPDQCCGSIYAMQPSESDCKVYGVNVINADGGIPYDPTRQVSLPNCGNCVRTIVGSYCLEPGETRTITIEFLDISGMVMCTKTLVRSCPPVDACCDKLKAEFVPASSTGPQPRCCMDIKITKQPGLSCDVYGIRLTGASGGISVQTSPISIPTGNPSNPNTLIVGQVCAPYGQSRTVTVEFLDANGDVLCTKTISFTCSESGGTPGSGGTNKTGAPSDSPLGAVRLQAMPNPTASATTIQYYLPDNAAIKLEVYNSLGRLVAVPEEGFRTMGDHSVTYATDDLPSGMYYIKLAIGDNVVTIPLVVTKK